MTSRAPGASGLQPVQLEPQLKRRIWGGRSLNAVEGAQVEQGAEPVGEAWLAYDGSHVLLNAAARRAAPTLAEWVARDPISWVGTAVQVGDGPTVPIMLKILDAGNDLSVQVHPSDAQVTAAQRAQGHRGKTESWVVLDAAADAQVLWGMKTAMRLDEARQVAARGDLHRVLKPVPVEVGSVIHNPAGTVHAVGRGLKIFELQQSSDITYRLDDYGRKGADGRTRDLHLEAGLAVSDLSGSGDPHPHVEPAAPPSTLVACDHYLLRDLTIRDQVRLSFSRQGIRFLTVVSGALTVTGPDSAPPVGPLTYPSTVAVPAAISHVTVTGRGRVFVSEASA